MSSIAAAAPQRKRWRHSLFQGLQKMGRSLQLPIAVLPAAGILNRLGQPDVFGKDGLGWTDVAKVMAGAGGALLDSSLGLPLLFAVGVAIGMAKKSDGSTALAAVAGFLVYYAVLHQFPDVCPSGATFTGVGLLGGVCAAPGGAPAAASYQNPGGVRRDRDGAAGRVVLAALPPGAAGGLAGLLQRLSGWCRSSWRSWRSCSRRCACGCGRRWAGA
ncbi:hypothetical protein GCM10020000_50820 [Streptomyces olivoverticillatus]